MLAAVISDTHLPRPTPWFESVYEQHLAAADVLIHCGDMVGLTVYHFLLQHPNLVAVHGNTCQWGVRDQLPAAASVDLGGLRVAVTHGWGDRPGTPARVAQALGPDHDLVCYGHTHAPDWAQHGDVRLLNPGSLQQSAPSLALLRLAPNAPPECRFIQP
ncbi:MAG: metallophosphoesterase family protein [Desulfovibrionaceae bacterium]